MDLLRKLYLLTAENVKRAREGQDPAETTTQRNDFKVNDLVLVRDMTSGAFAPCYMPNYRIVAIHGPNRIVVRDEKGNETLRRASHLKVCDWKQKVASMTPDREEYDKFGRSTKLLIHPRDITDLQFNKKSRNNSEILPDTEISMIDVNITSGRGEHGEILPNQQTTEKLVGHPGLSEEKGEFSSNNQNHSRNQTNNLSKKCIAGTLEECIGISSGSQPVNNGSSKTWFYNPMSCVSKWSKALKQGMQSSMGFEMIHTASITARESEKPDFSFFL